MQSTRVYQLIIICFLCPTHTKSCHHCLDDVTTTQAGPNTFTTGLYTRVTTEQPVTQEPIPWNENIPPVIPQNSKDRAVKYASTIVDIDKNPICSGTIISQHFVLTACVNCLRSGKKPLPANTINVAVGDYSSKNEEGLQLDIYEVKEVIAHPQCARGERFMRYDIGLVQTINEIKYTEEIAAAIIPDSVDYVPDTKKHKYFTLSSFRPNNINAKTRNEAVWFIKVVQVDPDTCQTVLHKSEYDPRHTYCTSYEHSPSDKHCEDDYGASLSKGRRIIGVLIHKHACGRSGSAASFTNVAYNSKWIRDTVKEKSNKAENI